MNDGSIGTAIAKRQYEERREMLALCGQDIMILAAFGNYGNHRAWLNVTSGEQGGGEDRLLIERWCVGTFGIDQKFVPQLRFPEDFKRDARTL